MSKQSCRSDKKSAEAGFSLIEVSIALLVISLLVLPIIHTYNLYIQSRKLAITDGVTSITRAAVIKYYEKNGVYPIPANPSIAQGVAGFGAQATIPAAGWPACTEASTAVCQTANSGFGTGVALIGDVPFAALGIPFKSTIDGYGSKLKYAVTLSQTAPPFSDTNGAIEILDNAGNSIYSGGTQRSHFAVISFGDDKMGAFTLGGIRAIACNIATAPVPIESENCDNDAIFRSNINATSGKVQRFDADGANKFDDLVSTTNTSAYGLWSYIPNTGLSIEARNGGNIKIGTCTIPALPAPQFCIPYSHVDVTGDVTATVMRTSRFCLGNQNSCTSDVASDNQRDINGIGVFSPKMLTGAPAAQPPNAAPNPYSAEGGTWGAGIRCYTSNALRGIRNYDEDCTRDTVPPQLPAAAQTGANCAPGTYASGIVISSDGTTFSLTCTP